MLHLLIISFTLLCILLIRVDIGPLYMWRSNSIFFMLVHNCYSIYNIILNLFCHVVQNCYLHAELVSLLIFVSFFFFGLETRDILIMKKVQEKDERFSPLNTKNYTKELCSF